MLNEKVGNRKDLPIFAKMEEILAAVRKNQVTIVIGETGSGKSTQLPGFLYANGIARTGAIAITEPRRIAAVSLARFVARELDVTLGAEVGYKVRFDNKTSAKTEIKFLTDGMLLREAVENPDLANYSVIMVDEAHERNTNIDLILGLLKRLIKKRPEFKVIISSATIDAKKFSAYFGGAPVVEVSGRLHPITVIYDDRNLEEDSNDAMARVVAEKVTAIHHCEGDGDVLIFLPGEDVINLTSDELEKQELRNAVILPVHGKISPEDQQKVFAEYPGQRKIVLATNIAETSITIDGVVYVVDSGFIKEMHFRPLSGIPSLDVVKHSQSGCNQRAGRAGRTRPGVCYRLYSEADFKERPLHTEPEIKRTSLAGLVLQMEAMGIADVPDFDFIDPPEKDVFREAYGVLVALGALVKGKSGLTELGKAMAALPLEPAIARMLLEAEKHGCTQSVATVAAFFSLPKGVFSRPKGKENDADYAHRRFKNTTSDALTFLAIWKAYAESGYNRGWCRDNFLNSRSLWEAKSIREQLLEILSERGTDVAEEADEDAVLKSVAAGLIWNLFMGSRGFRSYTYHSILRQLDHEMFVHPGSAMFSRNTPQWIVANELVETTKPFMRGCSIVEPKWLPDLAPSRFAWGERSVVSYVSGEKTARVRSSIVSATMFGGKEEVARVEEETPVETARAIQAKWVAEAEKNGWVLLAPVEDERGWRLSALMPNKSFCEVGRFSTSVHVVAGKGKKYYCEIMDSSYRETLIAMPKFEYFNLGGDEAAQKAAEKAAPEVVVDAVTAFNQKFGAAKTQRRK